MCYSLAGEIVNLTLKQRSLDDKRREALNKIIDTKGETQFYTCVFKSFLLTH